MFFKKKVGSSGGKKSKTVLKFVTPAGNTFARWREGLPTGNGVVGVNVLGGVGRETIIVKDLAINRN